MRVGPFKLDRPIGQGGMATVWGGVHVHQGAAIAFKFLRPEKDTIRATLRFLDESRALARMNHPGIVRIFDAGICDEELSEFLGTVEPGSPYFVMEAISGGTLSQDIVSDWSDCRQVLLSLLDALAHAHARDVIHRDIKPSNVLVDDHGIVRLTDFGISRLTRSEAVHDRVTGTPSYMAPEQITAQARREGPWTDLYALGCLGYWLVSGVPPFEGDVGDVLSAHLSAAPPKLTPRFGVPDGFERWCQRLLAKDPQARFVRCADAAAALVRLGDDTDTPATARRTGRFRPGETTVVFTHLTAESRVPVGGSVVGEAPPPPKDWRTETGSDRGQLLSTGPGMLNNRQPTFVGRTAERQALWDVLHEVWHNEGDVSLAVTGASGIGRRALSRWFGRRAHETGAVHVLVFDADVEADAKRQLRQWWAEMGDRVGAHAFWAARGAMDELSVWDLNQIETLAGGGEIGGPSLSAVHARWTARLSRDRVVLYIADNQDVLAMFDAAARIAPARRILVAPTSDSDGFQRSIPLEPLADHHIEALLFDLVGLSARSQRQLAMRAEGNPGTATALARLAIQSERLVDRGAGLQLRDLDGLFEALHNRWEGVVEERLADRPKLRTCARLLAESASRATQNELAEFCKRLGLVPQEVLQELGEAGLIEVGAGQITFAHPLARRAARSSGELTREDHAIIHDVFKDARGTPRRRLIATLHGYRAGVLDVESVRQTAVELRSNAQTREAIDLLRRVVSDTNPVSSERTALSLELAECYLSRQEYDAVGEALELIEGDETESVRALRLFLRMRRLEDVRDELLEIDPGHLSETASRLISYTLMDMGLFDRARETLLAMDATYDPPGRLYALARLNFLQGNWAETERWGSEAAARFEQVGRPDGAIAARDIVASATLKSGRYSVATDYYRENLRAAERLGAARFVQQYNLGVCLIESEQLSEEADVLLERAVGEALQRGRTDVEHAGRCAQVLYALLVGNEYLAERRIERLREIELGPWLQSDSRDFLEQARKRAPAQIAPALEEMLEAIDSMTS